MFSGDGERLDEPELLVDHADAGGERVPRGREADRLAEEHDLPLVRLVEARDDVRERRLACAVLAEQRVHLAGRGGEVDPVVGDDAGEPLRDPAQLEGRRGLGGRDHRPRSGGNRHRALVATTRVACPARLRRAAGR